MNVYPPFSVYFSFVVSTTDKSDSIQVVFGIFNKIKNQSKIKNNKWLICLFCSIIF